MKIKPVILFFAVSALMVAGCSEEPPSVRVHNQHTEKANVQIKTSNGNTINHNDIEPGAYTDSKDISEGDCLASAVIQKDSSAPAISFRATNDHSYTVVVVKGTPSYLRIDSKSK